MRGGGGLRDMPGGHVIGVEATTQVVIPTCWRIVVGRLTSAGHVYFVGAGGLHGGTGLPAGCGGHASCELSAKQDLPCLKIRQWRSVVAGFAGGSLATGGGLRGAGGFLLGGDGGGLLSVGAALATESAPTKVMTTEGANVRRG